MVIQTDEKCVLVSACFTELNRLNSQIDCLSGLIYEKSDKRLWRQSCCSIDDAESSGTTPSDTISVATHATYRVNKWKRDLFWCTASDYCYLWTRRVWWAILWIEFSTKPCLWAFTLGQQHNRCNMTSFFSDCGAHRKRAYWFLDRELNLKRRISHQHRIGYNWVLLITNYLKIFCC